MLKLWAQRSIEEKKIDILCALNTCALVFSAAYLTEAIIFRTQAVWIAERAAIAGLIAAVLLAGLDLFFQIKALSPHFAVLCWYPAVYFIGWRMERNDLRTLAWILEIFTGLLVVLFYNSLALSRQLFAVRNHAAVPTDRIRRTNRLPAVFCSAAALVSMSVLALFDIGKPLLALLREGLLRLLQSIVAFLSRLSSGKEPPAAETEAERHSLEEFFASLPQQRESRFWHAFWHALEIISALFTAGMLLLFCFWAIRGAVRALRVWLHRETEADERIEYLKPEEEARRVGQPARARRAPLPRTPEARIRRSYGAFLRRAAKKRSAGPPAESSPVFRKGDTPRMLEQTALGEHYDRDPAARELLHSLYERARYGNAPCSAAEARSAAKAAGILSGFSARKRD